MSNDSTTPGSRPHGDRHATAGGDLVALSEFGRSVGRGGQPEGPIFAVRAARVDAACDAASAPVATANLALLLSSHGRHQLAGQLLVLGHVPDALAYTHGVDPGILAEDPHGAALGDQHRQAAERDPIAIDDAGTGDGLAGGRLEGVQARVDVSEMGRRGREYVRANRTYAVVAPAVADVYQGLL